jgi:long-chain acyl-CoA synthetase
VACFGVPDRDLGERLVAVVQPVPGATPTGDELLAWCANTLAKYKLPRTITLVEEVPRNAMGKIDKKALRSSYVPS